MADEVALAESAMRAPWGEIAPIDCDVHPAVPDLAALLPYLPENWRDAVTLRGMKDFDTVSYPVNAPITARPDWRVPGGKAGSRLDGLREQVLRPFGTSIAICNCLYGVQALFSEDMAAAIDTRRQSMGGERVARPRTEAARLHRRADAERGDCRGRDRALGP